MKVNSGVEKGACSAYRGGRKLVDIEQHIVHIKPYFQVRVLPDYSLSYSDQFRVDLSELEPE